MKARLTVSLGAVVGLALVSAIAYMSTADIVPDRSRTKAGVDVVIEAVFVPAEPTEMTDREAGHE